MLLDQWPLVDAEHVESIVPRRPPPNPPSLPRLRERSTLFVGHFAGVGAVSAASVTAFGTTSTGRVTARRDSHGTIAAAHADVTATRSVAGVPRPVDAAVTATSSTVTAHISGTGRVEHDDDEALPILLLLS